MAVYGISSNTIQQLENKRAKFLKEFENIVKAVCRNYKQKYIIQYEDFEKTWGTDHDLLNKQIKKENATLVFVPEYTSGKIIMRAFQFES